MSSRKSREEIAAVYGRLSSDESLAYHIAHGRKENSSAPYDGKKLVEISKTRKQIDVRRLKEAAEQFRVRSIPRKDG